MLTQPAPRVSVLAAKIRARGHQVVELPFLRLVSLAQQPEPASQLAALESFDCAILVSPGAVDIVFDALQRPWPARVALAVVGPGSLAALNDRGIDARHYRIHAPTTAPFDSQALLREPLFETPRGLRAAVLRGELGRVDWIETLRQRGADVTVICIYRNEPQAPDAASMATIAKWSDRSEPVAWVFTTVQSVDACTDWLQQSSHGDCVEHQLALAIHSRVLAALEKQGWRNRLLIEPGEAALATALESRG